MIINIRIVLLGAITTIIYFWQIFCQWIAYNEPNDDDDDKNRTTKQKNRYCLSKKNVMKKQKKKRISIFFSLCYCCWLSQWSSMMMIMVTTITKYSLIDQFFFILSHTHTHTQKEHYKNQLLLLCVYDEQIDNNDTTIIIDHNV